MREYLLTLVVAAAVTYLLTPVARRFALRWGAMTAGPRPRRARHPDPAARRHRDAGRLRAPALAGRQPAALPRAAALRRPTTGRAAVRRGADLPARRRRRQVGARRAHQAGRPGARRRRHGAAGRADALPADRRPRRRVDDGVPGAFVLGPAEGAVLTIAGRRGHRSTRSTSSTGWTGWPPGIVAIAAAAFFAFSYLLRRQRGPASARRRAGVVAAALVGVCLGFLPHNFSPARIFMGDSGSMLHRAAARRRRRSPSPARSTPTPSAPTSLPALLPLLLPLAVMLVPFLDLLLADRPAHRRRPVAVRPRQAAPAPPAARARPQPRPRRAGHVPVVRACIAFGATAVAFLRPGAAGHEPSRSSWSSRSLLTMNIPRLRRGGGHLHRPAPRAGPVTGHVAAGPRRARLSVARVPAGARRLLAPAVVLGVAGVVAAVVAGRSGRRPLRCLVGAGLVVGFLLLGQVPVAQAARGRRGLGACLLVVLVHRCGCVLLLVALRRWSSTSDGVDRGRSG